MGWEGSLSVIFLHVLERLDPRLCGLVTQSD